MRLDLAVSRAFGLSRRAAREAVRAGRIDVDGATRDEPGLEVRDDAKLAFLPNRPPRYRVRSRLSVLAEDADFVIVDKPAGLLTVPTAEQEKDTLLARVLDYLHHRFGRRPVAYVVHRLDRDTSGAVVFARTRPALHFLQQLFKLHAIEREYVALVEGHTPRSGFFSADLAREETGLRRGVARRGRPGKRAVTRYRLLESLPEASLVSVELETGRTHQIRIHFAAAGHPVLGDRVYGRRHARPLLDVPRQMLHARRLGFAHPRTGSPVRVESEPPEDFRMALARLRGEKEKRPGSTGAFGMETGSSRKAKRER